MASIDEIKQRLTRIFRDTFDDEQIELAPTTSAADIEGWDSLSHITLVVACEKEFGVKLSPREVASLENVGEMIAVLEKRATR